MFLDRIISKAKHHSKNGDFTEAKKIIEEVLIKFPNNIRLQKIFNSLKEIKKNDVIEPLPNNEIIRIDEYLKQKNFVSAHEKAKLLINQFPNSPFLNNTMGIIFDNLNQNDLSIQYFKTAIKLVPNNAIINFNLANVFFKIGNYKEAINFFKSSIENNKTFSDAYFNLGILYQKFENFLDLSIYNFIKAIDIQPLNQNYLNGLMNTLTQINKINYSKELENILISISDNDSFRSSEKSIVINKFLLSNPDFSKILNFIELGKNSISFILINSLERIPLFIKLLELGPITDPKIENFLTKVRKFFLNNAFEKKLENKYLNFYLAMSSICFDNEFVFNETFEESEIINKLENQIKIKSSKRLLSIIILSSYRPLFKYDLNNYYYKLNKISLFKKIIQKQFIDIHEETLIKNNIKSLSKINNQISYNVKNQYEENPYPRWNSAAKINKLDTISNYLKKLDFKINESDINDKPNVLIAGCGTGQQAIERNYFSDNILAVDLSFNSLSYAIRKVQERKIKNINFLQCDILDLEKLNQKFDIIESVGVLHHMENPFEGWKVLNNILKPKGLMLIGLYSETARSDIKFAREFISKNNYNSNDTDIRNFRSYILSNNYKDEFNKIKKSYDFYSLSSCRDLLFHVKEHRFNINQITSILKKLGLNFLGFQHDNVLIPNHFKRMYENNNLQNWGTYEESYPHTFSKMYQFWVQKN